MVGPHGAGKSTIAAALAARGLPVDYRRCAAREESSRGHGWPNRLPRGLKLWPDGAALVLGPAVSLPRLTPTWDKRTLGVDRFGVTAAPAPVPVRSILFLEWSDSIARSRRSSRSGPLKPSSGWRLTDPPLICSTLPNRRGSFTRLPISLERSRDASRADATSGCVPCLHRSGAPMGERR